MRASQAAREVRHVDAAERPGPVEVVGQRVHPALELPRHVRVCLTPGDQIGPREYAVPSFGQPSLGQQPAKHDQPDHHMLGHQQPLTRGKAAAAEEVGLFDLVPHRLKVLN